MKHDVKLGDDEIDQLLARGRLSGAQYDEIERRVLAQSVPRRKSRWLYVLTPAAALASVLGVWLVSRDAPQPGEFTAKSGGEPARAVVDVGCGGSSPDVCRLGETLMFSVGASDEVGYLVAYAERLDAPAAPRIWYFPVRDGSQPRVEPAATTRVLQEGVRLGAPHAAGRYRVRAWLAPAPVDRTAIEQDKAGVPDGEVLELVE